MPEDSETVEQTLDPGKEQEPMQLETGKTYCFTVQRLKKAHLLEIEDAHFHHDSAVLMPDYTGHIDPNEEPDPDRLTGLSVLRGALVQADEHPNQKLLVAGHTDTSGNPSYNFGLSADRAENVYCALKGDKAGWVAVCEKKHKVEDYQQILTWVDRLYGYDCNPQGVDNKLGPKTRAAIKSFQESYNVDYSKSIAEDGKVGEETWGAFFDVYMKTLAEVLLETDAAGLSQRQGAVTYLGPDKVGCGESHPIEAKEKKNFRSATNRRVELLFFDPGEEPDINACHPGGSCNPEACKLYDDQFYERRHLGALPVPGTMLGITLHVVDEIGMPLAQTDVTLNFDNGAQSNLKTNDQGKIQVALVEGVDFEIEIKDVQEIVGEHGATTPSGTHLAPEDPASP